MKNTETETRLMLTIAEMKARNVIMGLFNGMNTGENQATWNHLRNALIESDAFDEIRNTKKFKEASLTVNMICDYLHNELREPKKFESASEQNNFDIAHTLVREFILGYQVDLESFELLISIIPSLKESAEYTFYKVEFYEALMFDFETIVNTLKWVERMGVTKKPKEEMAA